MSPAFRRFWWGEAVSGMGTGITTLALQTIVLVTLGGSAVEAGWLNSARWLPYLVLGLVVGALVDRVRRRPVMVATDLVRAALLAAVPAAWSLDRLSLGLVLVVVVLFGTASLFNDAASQSFVPRIVAREDLQRAHARLDAADAVATTTGPALAGVLVRVLGAPLSMLVDAATYVFSAVVVASLRDVAEPPRRRGEGRWLRELGREIVEGTRWVYRGSGLRRLAVATHVWFAGQTFVVVTVAPFAYLHLGLSPVVLGLVLAAGGVGALAGATTTTALGRRVGTGGAVITTHAVSTIAVVVMLTAAWATRPVAAVVLAVGQLGHGWSLGAGNSHEMAVRQSLTPDELQARTNTTMRSLNRAVVVVVSPVAGLVAAHVGYAESLGVGAGVFAVSTLMLLASPFRSLRV